MASIIVLGAGMVGVSTALALQARGHTVTLVDRTGAGTETSYGNAGAIQVEAAEPYAMPRDARTLLRYGLGLSNDVTFSPRGVLSMLPALRSYARQSRPDTHQAIAAHYHRLTGRASADHAPLIEASGAGNLISRNGLAIFYRSVRAFDGGARDAERLQRNYGVASRILAGDEYRTEEPALKAAPVGVVHYTDTWSCADPGRLTQLYTELFMRRGGRFVIGDAASLADTGGRWTVTTAEGTVDAERVVVALGPWSGRFLARFGRRVPMILKRGYHAHYGVEVAPRRPFLDAANGIVAAPMRQGLRLSSGAALVAHDAPADPRQLVRGRRAVGTLVELGAQVEQTPWFGTRPCLPRMLPMVGPVPERPGLWVNFGHGHQGFTLGPTTGLLLAEAMDGAGTDLHKALTPDAHERPL